MKLLLMLSATAMLSLSALADGIIKDASGNYIIFRDEPGCILAIADKLPPDVQTMLHPAEANIDGVEYKACYLDGGNAYYVLYEDGDQSAIPKSMVQEYNGV